MGMKPPKLTPPVPQALPLPVDPSPVNPAVKKARNSQIGLASNIRKATLLTSPQGLDLQGGGLASKTLLGT